MPNHVDFSRFSQHLFWDTNRERLNAIEHAEYILTQVVEYGTLNDWRLLEVLYTKEDMLAAATNVRSLDSVSISFLAHYLGVDRTVFKCYTPKPSVHDFWKS